MLHYFSIPVLPYPQFLRFLPLWIVFMTLPTVSLQEFDLPSNWMLLLCLLFRQPFSWAAFTMVLRPWISLVTIKFAHTIDLLATCSKYWSILFRHGWYSYIEISFFQYRLVCSLVTQGILIIRLYGCIDPYTWIDPFTPTLCETLKK